MYGNLVAMEAILQASKIEHYLTWPQHAIYQHRKGMKPTSTGFTKHTWKIATVHQTRPVVAIQIPHQHPVIPTLDTPLFSSNTPGVIIDKTLVRVLWIAPTDSLVCLTLYII